MTVAILSESAKFEPDFSGVMETYYRDSGAGGQHRNKTDTGVRLTHPSGIVVTCADSRSQWQNRQSAWAELERRLEFQHRDSVSNHMNQNRITQSTERGWTWTEWRDEVVDRSTGRRALMSRLLKGRDFHKMSS